MKNFWTAQRALLALGLLAWLAVGAALVSQYQFGMQPCPWCVLQRLIFILIGAVGIVAWLVRHRLLFKISGVVMVLLALSGVASAAYQHLVAAKSFSCNLTLADRIVGWTGLDRLIPSVFEVRASCAEASVHLLGLPYVAWSGILFAVIAVTTAWVLTKKK